MGDAGDDELLGYLVGEVVVRGEDDRPVVVMAFEQRVERIEFLRGRTREFLGSLLGNQRSPAVRIVGGVREELLVALGFPEVEIVRIDVLAIDAVLLVVLGTFVVGQLDLHMDGFVLAEILAGELIDLFLIYTRTRLAQ